jgi:hypothetical protein
MIEVENNIVNFLGQMGKVETLVDGSIKIQFTTQEMQGGEIADILAYRNKMVRVVVGEDKINEIPRLVGESLKKKMAETGKGSLSSKQRKALYLLYNANAELKHNMTFEEYYENRMISNIEAIYKKLDSNDGKTSAANTV